jgi:SanA protein
VLKRVLKCIYKVIQIAIFSSLAIVLIPRLITALYSFTRIISLENAPHQPAAIVFGAGLWRDGTPTAVLRDRIEIAAQLYFSGKIEKILMSGDNRFVDYNEPGAMRAYAISLGIPESVIVLDYAGRRTYDTCYRAYKIFGLDQAVLVTQSFHLPRALYTCNALGMHAIGVASDQREYRLMSKIYWNLRELPATLSALLDVHLLHPIPVLGDPEPIFPSAVQ